MTKIVVFSSTDRPDSNCDKVARYVTRRYQEIDGVEAQFISLQDYPTADVAGGKYGNKPESVLKFNQPFMDADGIVFVVPEYNGSFPGILKLFIDYLPFPDALKDRAVAYIGEASGYFGGLRAIEQLQMVAAYRYAVQFQERVFIPAVHKDFDEETGIKDEFKQGLLEAQTRNFVKFVRALKE